MPYLAEHFPPRNLVVKESTPEEFSRLNINKAPDPTLTAMPPLPPSFSIKTEMTAVEDQGSAGTCTSFCVTACLEHLHQRDLSEGQLTHEAERTYGDCQEGLALVHAYQTAANPGSIDEALWPYDPQQICWTNPPAIGTAQRYKFGSIGYIYNRPRANVLSELRSAPTASPGLPLTSAIQIQIFSRRKAVSVSVPVVWSVWPWSGEIQMPTSLMVSTDKILSAAPGTSGWHCIPLCGWDNTTGRFLFKNSWGNFWGQNGYGTIPYQYIESYSDVGMIGW